MEHTLTEKQLAHALFYALKINDFEHADYLLSLNSPVNTSYFAGENNLVYTSNMMVGKAAEIIKKYGASHAKSQLLLKILDRFIDLKCDLRCHCNPKNPHYCAMSEAFKHIEFKTEDDLLVQQNLLILKLLYHGATYKNLNNQKPSYKENAIRILNSYIQSKKDQVIQLIKLNRHSKSCTNRHSRCCNRQTKIERI